MNKAIIFDAGTMINFSMNSLLDLFEKLKKIFNGHFLITEEVKYETIKRPLGIKKFELSALRVQKLLKKGILELPRSLNIKDSEIRKRAIELLKISNNAFIAKNRPLHLIDKGESASLALSEILTKKGIKNVISVDERTTRMLCEKPENLRQILENKLHIRVQMKKQNLEVFKKFKIIRSTELAYIAYKHNLLDINDPNLLDALLYAIKFKGCSISREEIEEMKRL